MKNKKTILLKFDINKRGKNTLLSQDDINERDKKMP